jgi:hypothetical protein
LNVARVGNNVVLSLSTDDSGYTLEAKTELNSLPNWSNVPSTPTILGNQSVVTNSLTSGSQFFRLKK